FIISARKTNGYGSSLVEFAGDFDFAAVQLDTAFDNDEAQAGAGTFAYVARAMKGVKEPVTVLLRDANATIFNAQNNFFGILRDEQAHGAAGWRVLDGVGDQIGQDVTEKAFVNVGFFHARREREFDRANGIGGG